MASFLDLLKEKNDRLNSIPLSLQTVAQQQQKKVLNDVLLQLGKLDLEADGSIKITSGNIKLVGVIADDLKGIFNTKEYLKAVKTFGSEFVKQASINDGIIKKGVGDNNSPLAARVYVNSAKENAIKLLTGVAIENEFTKPIKNILENAVVNGSSVNDTIDNIRSFVEGSKGDSKILKYVKTITNDTFAIADRSYTSIVSEALGSEWFYFAGTKVENTRCFCGKRVGNYYHYKEIESWANGENLGECDLGNGTWAGEIPGTNASTIYSLLGGFGCLHSLMPVSEAIVPDSDIKRARDLGYIK